MVTEAVLFDLEGTLVDVDAIAALRERRRWSDYVRHVDRSSLYPGVSELLNELELRDVRWAVVTNVPAMLANALLACHKLEPAASICFHDVPRGHHKPHPAMCAKALSTLGVVPKQAVGVGDRQVDGRAFRAAGLNSYCAAWNSSAEPDVEWNGVLARPLDLLTLLE